MLWGLQPPTTYPWSGEVKEGIRAFRPDCVRLYPDTPDAELMWLRQEFPNLVYVFRPLADGKLLNGDAAFQDLAPWLNRLVFPAPFAQGSPRRLFEAWNEPNHETAHGDGDYEEFRGPFTRLVELLRQYYPMIELISPGLAPMQDDVEWDIALVSEFELCHYIGNHTYWQNEEHLSGTWGRRIQSFRLGHHKKFWITEIGDASNYPIDANAPSGVRATRTLAVLEWLEGLGYVEGAIVFLPIPTDGWRAFGLAMEDLRRFGERTGGQTVNESDLEAIAADIWQRGGARYNPSIVYCQQWMASFKAGGLDYWGAPQGGEIHRVAADGNEYVIQPFANKRLWWKAGEWVISQGPLPLP